MIEYITPEKVKSLIANLSHLVFEVTDACNLRCKYCAYGEFYDDYDERNNRYLPIEKAIKLINYLYSQWTSYRNTASKNNILISFYGGEPLLNFRFIQKIVNYVTSNIKDSRLDFSFAMTTNGLLLDKYVDFLYEKQFHLLISLDGDITNNSYRVDTKGCNSFERIVHNINLIKKKYPSYFSEFVNFNAVIHNMNSVESIYDFFTKTYGKIPRIGELNTVGIRKDKIEAFHQMFKSSHYSLLESKKASEIEDAMFLKSERYKELCLFLHQYSGYMFEDYCDLICENLEKVKIPTGTCLPFSKKMFITVNGKILPCERIGHHFYLGQIDDKKIELNPIEIAQKYNRYYNKISKQCTECFNQKACKQCLFSLDNIETEPICRGFMNEEDFRIYSQRQLLFLSKHPEKFRQIMEKSIII